MVVPFLYFHCIVTVVNVVCMVFFTTVFTRMHAHTHTHTHIYIYICV